MSSRLRASAALLLLSACATVAPPKPPVVETVAPRPEDVGSVEGVLKAFYEVTNIAPGAPRQWARDRTLYVPWIRFVALGPGATGRPKVTVIGPPSAPASVTRPCPGVYQSWRVMSRVQMPVHT